MVKDQSTLASIHHQSHGSLDAGDGESKITKIMYKYCQIIDDKNNQKSNQRPPDFAEEESKHIVDYDHKELQEIINESKNRVRQANATVDELFKNFELEYSSLNKAIDDLRQKIALLRIACHE